MKQGKKGFSLVYLFYGPSELEDVHEKISQLAEVRDFYSLEFSRDIMEELSNTWINLNLQVFEFRPLNPRKTNFKLELSWPIQIFIPHRSFPLGSSAFSSRLLWAFFN